MGEVSFSQGTRQIHTWGYSSGPATTLRATILLSLYWNLNQSELWSRKSITSSFNWSLPKVEAWQSKMSKHQTSKESIPKLTSANYLISWQCLQGVTTSSLENPVLDSKAFGCSYHRWNATNQHSRQGNASMKSLCPNSFLQLTNITRFCWKNAKSLSTETKWMTWSSISLQLSHKSFSVLSTWEPLPSLR